MLAYCFTKFGNDTTRLSFNHPSSLIPVSIPIISGFFATYLNAEKRFLHLISFLAPITEDPSSEAAAKSVLKISY